MLYSGEIDEFVEKELLPDAAETMNALSEAEKTAVSLLLKAYIGFLSEEATVYAFALSPMIWRFALSASGISML